MPEPARPSAAFTWAAAVFRRSPGVLVALAAVVAVLQLGGNLALQPVADAVAECLLATTDGQQLACQATLSSTTTVAAPVFLVALILSWLAGAGVYRAALAASRGHQMQFAMLWRSEHLGAFVLASIASGLVVLVAVAAIGLPAYVISSLVGGPIGSLIAVLGLLGAGAVGVVLGFLLLLAPIYALDRGSAPASAISSSIGAMRSNVGPAVVMVLVMLLLSTVGGFCFGVLSLVTVPIMTLFVVHMYRQFNREPIG